MTIAIGMMTLTPGDDMAGEAVEMLVSHHPQAGEMDAYERLLGDAMEETRLCLPARITWKRHGESSIRR